MIEYQKLNSGTPNDVEVITDDQQAEMAALEDMVKECGFEIELPKERAGDGKFRFMLPGGMVGEFSETVYDIDGGKLQGLIEQWNVETVKAAEVAEKS